MMNKSPIYFATMIFTGICHACGGSTSKIDRCYDFYSPTVKAYNTIPDTIMFTGISTIEIHADYSFEVEKLKKGFKLSFDSSFTKIHSGLNVSYKNSTITLTGKTNERGSKFVKINAIDSQRDSIQTIILAIKILGIYDCL